MPTEYGENGKPIFPTFRFTPERQAELMEWLYVSRRNPAPLGDLWLKPIPLRHVLEASRRGIYGVTPGDRTRVFAEGIAQMSPTETVSDGEG